mmetsp:Transcript_19701/g.18767  ORF Transcript_19701/g.18767 Transcript_19701/m.18767 type:complete len:174 (+) Transcript_19701:72-593(+)
MMKQLVNDRMITFAILKNPTDPFYLKELRKMENYWEKIKDISEERLKSSPKHSKMSWISKEKEESVLIQEEPQKKLAFGTPIEEEDELIPVNSRKSSKSGQQSKRGRAKNSEESPLMKEWTPTKRRGRKTANDKNLCSSPIQKELPKKRKNPMSPQKTPKRRKTGQDSEAKVI